MSVREEAKLLWAVGEVSSHHAMATRLNEDPAVIARWREEDGWDIARERLMLGRLATDDEEQSATEKKRREALDRHFATAGRLLDLVDAKAESLLESDIRKVSAGAITAVTLAAEKAARIQRDSVDSRDVDSEIEITSTYSESLRVRVSRDSE